jgi:hypothetical protein
MATKNGDTKAAAAAFNLTPSALVKILRQDKACATKLQGNRKQNGQKALKL